MTKAYPPHARVAALLLLGFLTSACGDDAEAAATPDAESVCPSCVATSGGETTDFGELSEGPGSGSTRCPAEEAPLTDAVRAAFELESMRAFLEGGAHTVEAQYRPDPAPPGPVGDPVDVELRFELGDFVYHETSAELSEGIECDSVRAPARVEVEVGEGLLSFTATGVVWKQAGHLAAIFYADADLAYARGSYRPALDDSRPHVGQIEVSLYVFADQLRGQVIPAALYFDDEQALSDYLNDEPYAGADYQTLFVLQLPSDDACEDNGLPLSPDAASVVLGDESPRAVWDLAAARIADAAALPAVWKDGSETEVTVELSGISGDAVCAESGDAPFDFGFTGTEILVYVPSDGRLRTSDGVIDAPVTDVELALGFDDLSLRRARVRSVVEVGELSDAEREARGWQGDRLDAWVTYSFLEPETRVDGLVELQDAIGDTSWSPSDCLALPPGGEWDTGHCRYTR